MNNLLLLFGSALLLLHRVMPLPVNIQICLFLLGVLLVGVPHGAADVLVGLQNAKEERKTRYYSRFLTGYLIKLVAFSAFFYFFPAMCLVIFFVMAAFHFGETDLHHFDTSSATGKFFVLSYGLLIVGSILLLHVEEAGPLLAMLGADATALSVIEGLGQQKAFLLPLLLIVFFGCTFIHFLHSPGDAKQQDSFLWRLVVLLVLLYLLPLLLGFFFYFVVWHSITSLQNIIRYLQTAGKTGLSRLATTVFTYSMVSFAGIALACYLFQMVFQQQALTAAAFGALVVLTAPHMMVMHDMYRHLRKQSNRHTGAVVTV